MLLNVVIQLFIIYIILGALESTYPVIHYWHSFVHL